MKQEEFTFKTNGVEFYVYYNPDPDDFYVSGIEMIQCSGIDLTNILQCAILTAIDQAAMDDYFDRQAALAEYQQEMRYER